MMTLGLLLLAACQNNTNQKIEQQTAPESKTKRQTETSDIDGTIWGEKGDKGIILSHGAAYDTDSWEEQGKQLAENGMIAFAVEDTSPENLNAAAKTLKDDDGVEDVSLLGASAGGASAIDAVQENVFDFDKIILLSPGGDATELEDIPVLVIYSKEERLEALENTSREDTETSIKTLAMPGSAHAQEIFDDDEKADEVMEEILDWLDK